MNIESMLESIESAEVIKLSAVAGRAQVVDDRVLNALATKILAQVESPNANTTIGPEFPVTFAEQVTGEGDSKLAWKILAGDLRNLLKTEYGVKLVTRTASGTRSVPLAKAFGWTRSNNPTALDSDGDARTDSE